MNVCHLTFCRRHAVSRWRAHDTGLRWSWFAGCSVLHLSPRGGRVLVMLSLWPSPRTMLSGQALFEGMYPGAAANLIDGTRIVNWLIRDASYEDIVPNADRCPAITQSIVRDTICTPPSRSPLYVTPSVHCLHVPLRTTLVAAVGCPAGGVVAIIAGTVRVHAVVAGQPDLLSTHLLSTH